MNEAQNRSIEILLVEDDADDSDLTVEAFKQARVQNHLSVVEDGEEALAYLRRQGRYANAPRPNLVLLDLNLPRRSGHEVLAEVKSDPALRRIPIVVLTTSSSDRDIATSYDLSANCYITKPMDLDSFLDVVNVIERFWLDIVKLPQG